MTLEDLEDDGPYGRIILHLANGKSITLTAPVEDEEEADPEEAAQDLMDMLDSLPRPKFIRIANVLVHTQALSAVEVDIIDTQE